MLPDTPLVIHGVLDWLTASMGADEGSDSWRSRWRDDLQELLCGANSQQVTLIIILNEVGRGIVPMDRDQRRLRDLNGWFSQDMAECADQVWYVRHGLVQALGR
ncbi:bifunctional adenosylcobinamide kinase/adenosylcobinamide-phosphate guanylyltransferase [Vreelandella aquamarina]|uniref:bifunctional adenosylcobinamide kinase/adenosylcobinamide-phosphate guanylyltransferase n=1 Tax=Vreelandella aquamarina TaxID=77097 RepID=UPI00295EEA59|nr:bifunctional adenosylcobinamide kinase/adenosylcobinamide-phosphate guanylyltransferase [Halomonas aquamarina]